MSKNLFTHKSVTWVLLFANVIALFLVFHRWQPSAFDHVLPKFSCNLACQLKKHPEFKDKFQPDVPVFFDARNAYPYLKPYAHLMNFPHIELALEQLESVNQKTDIKNKHYQSCAVVGSSQNLFKSGYGKLIDSHQAVFRMNDAPTIGYEEDVGSKTNLQIFHSGRAQYGLVGNTPLVHGVNYVTFVNTSNMNHKNFYQAHSRRTILMLQRIGEELYPNLDVSSKKLRNIQKQLDKLFHPIPKKHRKIAASWDFFNPMRNQLHMLHPQFRQYVEEKWWAPKNRHKQAFPSTGFITLVSAMHMCDRISAFGFGLDTKGRYGHYYERKLARSPWHSRIEYQDQFLDHLDKAGIIKLYRGN